MKRPTPGVRFERPAWAASLAGEEDTDLLARVAAGDRGDPLCELYRRYEARLYGYGLRLLGDAGLAEELVQETILRVWRTAGSFDAARGSVATFIFTLARRIAIDLWRRPSSRPFRSTLDPSRVTVDDPAEEVLVGLVVQGGLQALSSAHREVLELSYRKGLKQSEIAEILDLPLGTVKTRTYYALRALKLALAERDLSA